MVFHRAQWNHKYAYSVLDNDCDRKYVYNLKLQWNSSHFKFYVNLINVCD